MHVDPSQRRGIRDVEGDDHVSTLTLVFQVGDNGRDRINAEIIRDRLLHLRRTIVVRRQRQLVGTIRHILERVGTRIEGERIVSLLDPRHFSGGIQRGLPVHESREGGDRLPGGVRVRGVEGVDAAQRTRAGLKDRRCARGLGPRDHVAVRLGQTDAISVLDEGVISQLHARGAVVDAGRERVRTAIGGEGIEDGCLAPVTVEAQVGHGQVGLGLGTRGEAHKTVKESAVGRISRSKGGELVAGGDIHADRRLTTGRDGDSRAFGGGRCSARIPDLDAAASPIRGATGEVSSVNVLGQGLGAQLVGRGRCAEVVEGDIKVPSGGPVPQVRLGAGLLGSANHGRVHRRGRGSQGVDDARALLTRRIEDTGLLGCVRDGASRAHDEVLHDVDLLARTPGREQRIRLHTLQDHSAHTRHLRGRHGRAGEVIVVSVQDGRVDAAAGGADLGLEAQVRGDAPRGEVRHRIVRVRGDGLTIHEGQVVICGREHGLTVLLGNERGGHVQGRDAHEHERVAGDVVVHQDAGGLKRRQVLDLLLEGQLAA